MLQALEKVLLSPSLLDQDGPLRDWSVREPITGLREGGCTWSPRPPAGIALPGNGAPYVNVTSCYLNYSPAPHCPESPRFHSSPPSLVTSFTPPSQELSQSRAVERRRNPGSPTHKPTGPITDLQSESPSHPQVTRSLLGNCAACVRTSLPLSPPSSAPSAAQNLHASTPRPLLVAQFARGTPPSSPAHRQPPEPITRREKKPRPLPDTCVARQRRAVRAVTSRPRI